MYDDDDDSDGVYYHPNGVRSSRPPQSQTPRTISSTDATNNFMNRMAGSSAVGTVGEYGKAGGGMPSDFSSHFSNPTADTGNMMDKSTGQTVGNAISGVGAAIQKGFDAQAQNARDAAKNIGNIKSAIPGPDEFKYSTPTLKQDQYV